MAGLPSWVRGRLDLLMGHLGELLKARALPFDDALRGAPTRHGVYVISEKHASPGKYLYAGRTKNGARGLQGRMKQHYRGGGPDARSDLVEMVQASKKAVSRSAAQQWISENCYVQWAVVDAPHERSWREHFIISVLRPIWQRD